MEIIENMIEKEKNYQKKNINLFEYSFILILYELKRQNDKKNIKNMILS